MIEKTTGNTIDPILIFFSLLKKTKVKWLEPNYYIFSFDFAKHYLYMVYWKKKDVPLMTPIYIHINVDNVT